MPKKPKNRKPEGRVVIVKLDVGDRLTVELLSHPLIGAGLTPHLTLFGLADGGVRITTFPDALVVQPNAGNDVTIARLEG